MLFLCILGGIRPSYSWILAYVELERINKGQHFQIGVVSKLASKFLPDDAFFMAASERLPYRSYYCCVSSPFGSVGIVLYNQEGCVVSTILTQIIFGIRARWRRYEWL